MENKYNMTIEQNIFLAKGNLVDNVYSNARLEGLNVSISQIRKVLEGINVPELKIDEIQCILNLRDAWKYVINNIDLDFNLEFISKVNEFVARNESIEWGKLRNGKVEITGTSYIPEIPKEENVKNDIAKILEIENTTERAIEYMLYGMRNQLFWDGNKRTSTICANKIMIQNGNGIIKIPDDKLQEFTTLLSEFYTTNEKEKIKQFIFDNCIDGIVFDN